MSIKEQGKLFGYPPCCIDWYCQYMQQSSTTLTEQQAKLYDHRGFIPCPTCAEKVSPTTLHTLISGRLYPEAFPVAPYQAYSRAALRARGATARRFRRSRLRTILRCEKERRHIDLDVPMVECLLRQLAPVYRGMKEIDHRLATTHTALEAMNIICP